MTLYELGWQNNTTSEEQSYADSYKFNALIKDGKNWRLCLINKKAGSHPLIPGGKKCLLLWWNEAAILCNDDIVMAYDGFTSYVINCPSGEQSVT